MIYLRAILFLSNTHWNWFVNMKIRSKISSKHFPIEKKFTDAFLQHQKLMPKRSVKLENDSEKLGNSPENDFWKYLGVNWHLTFSGKKNQKGKDVSFWRIQRNFILYNKIIKNHENSFISQTDSDPAFWLSLFYPEIFLKFIL